MARPTKGPAIPPLACCYLSMYSRGSLDSVVGNPLKNGQQECKNHCNKLLHHKRPPWKQASLNYRLFPAKFPTSSLYAKFPKRRRSGTSREATPCMAQSRLDAVNCNGRGVGESVWGGRSGPEAPGPPPFRHVSKVGQGCQGGSNATKPEDMVGGVSLAGWQCLGNTKTWCNVSRVLPWAPREPGMFCNLGQVDQGALDAVAHVIRCKI